MERFPNSRFHMRFVFASGFPDDSAHERLPVYGRFDIGFSQKFTFGSRINLYLREEILNLFDHVNVLAYDTTFEGYVVRHELSRRIFNLGLRIEK